MSGKSEEKKYSNKLEALKLSMAFTYFTPLRPAAG